MDDQKELCFVMQLFDQGGAYDKLYEEVFRPAIESAGLVAYRVDNDPNAEIPIDTIEQKISESVACFAELSTDNPNVWFELGYAIARNKPLCMVSSDTRKKYPFDVQHRQIIPYPAHSLPSDYETLKEKITKRLKAAVEKQASRQQNVAVANALSIGPSTEGLQSHELLALTMIFQEHFADGISPWSLNEEMTKEGGYIKTAANLAILGLTNRQLVEMRDVMIEGPWKSHAARHLFVTKQGEEWLIKNQGKLNLRLSKPEISSEISDDDIPF